MDAIQIVIVEDDAIIGADLQDRLEEMGYEVIGLFENGEDAYESIQKSSPDLLIMDVQLSGKWDGIETVRQISKKFQFPIIFLTGNSDEITFSKAKTTGPAAFLSKPYRGRDLKHAIELAIIQSAEKTKKMVDVVENESAYVLQDRLFVKVKNGMERLFFQDIQWVEANDYYCKVFTRTKEIQILQTLGKFSETLSNLSEFLRVHRSFIVNLNHVEQIGDLSLYIGKHQIPVSKSAREEIMGRLKKIS
ncbi:DNA-binding response regulator (plasmid) [Runella rosea]|uniref:DNA-binding response regulator n=1 Tax=Runella rosea TaxID=2259595 RepID=A0A344TTA5_9BACT|nr:response regulator [Runella rosea]AXE21876.1 DNA-binding response regulator [Runella rosea]